MCQELEQLYEDGKKEGREEGTLSTMLSNIRNLVETLGLTVEAAMNALKVPEQERNTYTSMLAEQ